MNRFVSLRRPFSLAAAAAWPTSAVVLISGALGGCISYNDVMQVARHRCEKIANRDEERRCRETSDRSEGDYRAARDAARRSGS
jgi:hypothetical protein